MSKIYSKETEPNIMIFTMKICPPQVNQKQTIVAEATGFVFVNPGTWALIRKHRKSHSAAKNRTQNRFNAQCKLSRRRLNRILKVVPSLSSLGRDTPKLQWGLCVAYLNSLCKGILLESHD